MPIESNNPLISDEEFRDSENFENLVEGDFERDEHGQLIRPFGLANVDEQLRRDSPWDLTLAPSREPCTRAILDGSWFIQFSPLNVPARSKLRGPMRIQAGPRGISVSGDVYESELTAEQPVFEPRSPHGLEVEGNWYPQLPPSEYRFYFASSSVYYRRGNLVLAFVHHPWNADVQDFNQQVSGGRMEFVCQRCRAEHSSLPRSTVSVAGRARFGGTEYNVVAIKTSPYYRGCNVEVDVVGGRRWLTQPISHGGRQLLFRDVFRQHGFDVLDRISELDIHAVEELTGTQLHELLSKHREEGDDPIAWRVWLLIASRTTGNTFGWMFDDKEPYREAAAVFFDAEFDVSEEFRNVVDPRIDGSKLGSINDAFLRTAVHEVGHIFGLRHPKEDEHVDIGSTIMNQTRDVIRQARENKTFPGNSEFLFDEQNAAQLIHRPDPQIAPGWKRFKWLPGARWGGVSLPVEEFDLQHEPPESPEFRLDLELPESLVRGEMVIAEFELTNIGEQPRRVSAALNLAEGDLTVFITAPGGGRVTIHDVVLACGNRRMRTLNPGEDISTSVQLFYTNQGLTFDSIGTYRIEAAFEIGDKEGRVVRSNVATMTVREPVSEEERELADLTMTTDVGRCFALGDFGLDAKLEQRLSKIVADPRFRGTAASFASALVLANSLSRDTQFLRSKAVRKAKQAIAREMLEYVDSGLTKDKVVAFASAVVQATDFGAPLLNDIKDLLEKHDVDDKLQRVARKIFDDFVS